MGRSALVLDLNDFGGESPHYDAEALSRALAACAARWVPEVFPNGRIVDGALRLANIKGAPPRKQGSCVIQLGGDHAGGWYDHGEGQGGEPLSTISEALGLRGDDLFRYAADLAERHGAASYLNGSARRNGINGKDRGAVSAPEIAITLAKMLPIPGTLAETYLRARGLSQIPDSPDLGFYDNTTHWRTQRGEPALIARFRQPDGTPSGGIHRIYLKPDGSWHTGEKKMLGTCDGALVMLAAPNGDGRLGVGEGIESTAAAMQMFGVPGWATCSDGGMKRFARWLRENWRPETHPIKGLLIWADAKRAGASAAGELYATAQEIGLAAELFMPKGGDDFADDLQKGLLPDTPPTTQQEVLPPPQTYEAVLATIETLSRATDPMTARTTVMIALHGMAKLRLDAFSEKQCLLQIKARTGMPIADLGKSLRQVRAEAGMVATRSVPIVTEICRRYVFVKAVNAFWDRYTKTIVALDAVRHAHWSDMPPDDDGEPTDPRDVMLKGRYGQTVDKVDSIGFLPGAPEIFNEEGSAALNMWSPPEIVPAEGDVEPFLEHVRYVLDGDRQAQDFLLDYLAHLVQRPALKIKNTILIIGKPGIGKSMIGEMIATLIGRHNATSVEESDLRSSFNEWMDGVQLVLVHELMSIDRQETMNRLKSYITDPELRINRKNIPTYRYRNRTNFIMFSNREDAARIEKGDRRYFIWNSAAEPRDKEYYAELSRWFDHCGAAFLLCYLLGRSLANFDANAAPPVTEAKKQIIFDSRNSIEAYMQAAFDALDPPFQHDLVTVNDIIDFLADRKKMRVSHKAVSMFLRQAGGSLLGQKRIGNRKLSVWAIRNQAEWEEASEGDLQRAYRDLYTAMMPRDEKDAILGRNLGSASDAQNC